MGEIFPHGLDSVASKCSIRIAMSHGLPWQRRLRALQRNGRCGAAKGSVSVALSDEQSVSQGDGLAQGQNEYSGDWVGVGATGPDNDEVRIARTSGLCGQSRPIVLPGTSHVGPDDRDKGASYQNRA